MADAEQKTEAHVDAKLHDDDSAVPSATSVPLRAKLWRAIAGRNRALKAKEMTEACAFYDAIRKDAKGVAPDVVIDVCGGHGALGMLFAAHGVARRVLIIDRHCPESHKAVLDAWKPFLGSPDCGEEPAAERPSPISYVEKPLQDTLASEIAALQEGGCEILVVACHACQHLARNVIDCCLAARVHFAVCPCCPKDAAGGIQAASRTLGVDFGTAMVLAEMGRIADQCSVHLRTFDSAISPHNRIIVGCMRLPDAAPGAASTDAAEERLRRAYDRAHRRPQQAEALGANSSAHTTRAGDGDKASASNSIGGCSPADYEKQLDSKAQWVQEKLQPLVEHGLKDSLLILPGLEVRRSPPKHFRARTIVSLEDRSSGGEGQGLFKFVPTPDGRLRLVNTVALETLVKPISDAVPLLAQLLSEGGLETIFRPGLSGVKLHATIGRAPQQLLVCFIYGRDAVPPGEQNLAAMAKALTAALEAEPTVSQTEVTAMSQARGVQHCFPTGRDFVDEELTVSGRGVLRYRQPFGQFSNPNPYMGIATAEWLCECVQLGVNAGSNGVPCTDLLELYCGAGSHTMALAPRFRHVLAVDINRHLVQAANYNVSANGLTNVSVIRAPSEEFCRRVIRKRSYEIRRQDGSCELELHFGCTIVDPPRAGLDDLTRAAVSGYDHVWYISCNPEALRRDLQELLTTHEVCRLVLLDHFPYSSHAECGVHLRKRAS